MLKVTVDVTKQNEGHTVCARSDASAWPIPEGGGGVRPILFIVAALAIASPAPAQERDSELTFRETRKMLHEYGRCVVKREQALASQAISRNVDNGELLRRYDRLIVGKCLPIGFATVAQVRFKGDQYRYALADALIRKELASAPAPDLETVAQLDHSDPGAPPTQFSPRGKRLSQSKYQEAIRGHQQAQAFTYLSRYGECVVRVNPAAARALLLTDPETPGEAAQFSAMQTALGTCLPENQTRGFGKLALRGTIAVNYYRLALAARQQPAGAPR